MEILDRSAPDYVDHELYTPYLIKNTDESQEKVLRYIGNVVVPGRHVVKILLDNGFEAIYKQKMEQKAKERQREEEKDTHT